MVPSKKPTSDLTSRSRRPLKKEKFESPPAQTDADGFQEKKEAEMRSFITYPHSVENNICGGGEWRRQQQSHRLGNS